MRTTPGGVAAPEEAGGEIESARVKFEEAPKEGEGNDATHEENQRPPSKIFSDALESDPKSEKSREAGDQFGIGRLERPREEGKRRVVPDLKVLVSERQFAIEVELDDSVRSLGRRVEADEERDLGPRTGGEPEGPSGELAGRRERKQISRRGRSTATTREGTNRCAEEIVALDRNPTRT